MYRKKRLASSKEMSKGWCFNKNMLPPTQACVKEKTTKRTIIHKFTYVYICTKFYTKGTVYSKVKATAVTSGQDVDNNWA